jgi:hypothetical protein
MEPVAICSTQALTGRSCVQNSDCPVGYWCQVGISRATNRCCRNLGIEKTVFKYEYHPDTDVPPCSQPVAMGLGAGRSTRWYMDLADGECGTCKAFVYRGSLGNQNNFRTRVECEATCSRALLATEDCSRRVGAGCGSICPAGQPLVLIEEDGRPTTCSDTRLCPRGYFCRTGVEIVSPVCCPQSE